MRMQNTMMETPFSELLTDLIGVIGNKLTAYLASATDTRMIDLWIAGAPPERQAEERIRFAYQVVNILRLYDEPEVVQAWLTGINPDLGDRTAIRMLRDNPIDLVGPMLLMAAKNFAVSG